MRPAEFSPEEIISAGQDLRAAGRNITGFGLRQKIGGGNPARLKHVWDEHLASHSVTKAEPVAELPVEVAEEVALVTKELTQRLSMLAVELNHKAVKSAEQRVHQVVRTAAEQRAESERELADATQTVDDLEAMLDKERMQVTTLEGKLAEVQDRAQAQAVEFAEVRAELAAITSKAEAIEQARLEQRQAAEEADQEARAAREDAANLRGQLDALKTQVTELMQALGKR